MKDGWQASTTYRWRVSTGGWSPILSLPLPTTSASVRLICISGLTMHSVLITNPDGKILLSRYFETSFRLQHNEDAGPLDTDAENAAGLDRPLSGGSSGGGGGGMSTMRDRAQAMKLSESEVLGQTRHLWTKGTVECPQVARAKACWRTNLQEHF